MRVKTNKNIQIKTTNEEPNHLTGGNIEQTLNNKVWLINKSYPNLKQLHYNPDIYTIDNFLTCNECDQLLSTELNFTLSKVVAVTDTGSNGSSINTSGSSINTSGSNINTSGSSINTSRTSTSTFLYDTSNIEWLLTKVKDLTFKSLDTFEPLQITKYVNTQQYLSHYDSPLPDAFGADQFLAGGGPRQITVLIYLNDVNNGGHTGFPKLKLNIHPKKGRALIFFPSFLNDKVDELTLHSGNPAIDTKYICQIWIRKKKYYSTVPA